jgi:hypothetical protein
MTNGPGEAERTGIFPVIEGVDVVAALEDGVDDTAGRAGALQAASTRHTATLATERRLIPRLVNEAERIALATT